MLSKARNPAPSQESSWSLNFSTKDAKERHTHPSGLAMLVGRLEALLKEKQEEESLGHVS